MHEIITFSVSISGQSSQDAIVVKSVGLPSETKINLGFIQTSPIKTEWPAKKNPKYLKGSKIPQGIVLVFQFGIS